MRASSEAVEPIRKIRHLPIDPERAFRLFTTGMGRWWPLTSHSIAGDDAIDVRFEGRVGGRVVEITRDGTEHSWADVLAWDPPHRLVLSWHPTLDPVASSTLEVRFVPDAAGTVMHLTHDGWEEFGAADGAALRDRYGPGWDVVLERLEAGVAAG